MFQGKFIASGQIGENADVCVWSFDTRKLLFRLNEHDHGICSVAFTEDEVRNNQSIDQLTCHMAL